MLLSKKSEARRKSPAATGTGLSVPAGSTSSTSPGRTLMSTASNSVASASSPLKMRTCVRSAASEGENVMRPRPSRTIAVGPSGVSATKAEPEGMSSLKSVA